MDKIMQKVRARLVETSASSAKLPMSPYGRAATDGEILALAWVLTEAGVPLPTDVEVEAAKADARCDPALEAHAAEA